MKRFLGILVSILLVGMIMTAVQAEDGSLVQWTNDEYVTDEYMDDDSMILYVLRPQIQLNARKGGGDNGKMYFGDEVTLLSHEAEWCYVQTADGRTGWIDTCFLGKARWKIRLENRVLLACQPGLDKSEFGSAAGGKRSGEEALVLYVVDDYLYVVTEEGCSGFVYRHDPGISYQRDDNW